MTSSTVACVRLCSQGHIDGHHQEQRVFYDDSTRLILVPRENKVEAYDLPTEDGFDPKLNRKCWEVNVDSLDQYISIQISLDARTLAIHRSSQRVQFVDRETGNIFIQGCSNPKREILGVFFVESKDYDLVMVTDTAIEFYNFASDKREGLKMVERTRFIIKWFTYTYPTRVLLIGTGQTGSRLTGYQFTSQQIIKLPFLELDPVASTMEAGDLVDAGSGSGLRKSASMNYAYHVVLLRLYNRVFFCHVDRKKKILRFYLIFMDVMMLAREYEMFNDALHFNVVDNVLLVHHTNSSVVAVYDLASPSSLPIGSPLPVSAEMFRKSHQGETSTRSTEMLPVSAREAPVKLQNVKCFNQEWRFFQPDLAIDENGNIYRFQLDLEGVVASYSDPAPLIGFLNRRRVAYVPSGHPRKLLISCLKSIIKKKYSQLVMREVFKMLHYDGSETVYSSTSDKITPAVLKLQMPMLKTKEVVDEVFDSLIQEEDIDLAHLEMCLIEFLKCVDSKKIPIDNSVYGMWGLILVKQKKHFQIQQLISGLKDAQVTQLAEVLENNGHGGLITELGLDVYARSAIREVKSVESEAMELYCSALLKHGRVIKALRVAQRHKVTSLKASQFMNSAVATNKEEVIAAVKRFTSEENVV